MAQALTHALDRNTTALATTYTVEDSFYVMSHMAIACQDWSLSNGSWETQQNRQHALEAVSLHRIGCSDKSLWSIGCRRWPVPVTNLQAPINLTTLSAPVPLVHAMWDPICNFEIAAGVAPRSLCHCYQPLERILKRCYVASNLISTQKLQQRQDERIEVKAPISRISKENPKGARVYWCILIMRGDLMYEEKHTDRPWVPRS